MDITIIYLLIIDTAIAAFLIKPCRKKVMFLFKPVIMLFSKKMRHRNDLRYMKRINGIHECNAIACQLEELYQVEMSIELARYHKMTGVTIKVPGSLSEEHEHTVLINGHDNSSKYLLDTINEEKERLRDALDKKIARLYRYGTTTEYTGTDLIEDANVLRMTSSFQRGSEKQ